MYTSSIVVLSDRRRSLARHSQYPRLLRLPLYPPCPTVRFVGVGFVCWLVRLWRSAGGGKARATTIEFQEWPIRIANRSALLLFRCCCCNVAFSRHVGTRYAHPPETGQHLLCHHCCGCGWFCISKCASGLRATPVVIASSPKIQLFVVSMLWGGWWMEVAQFHSGGNRGGIYRNCGLANHKFRSRITISCAAQLWSYISHCR